MLSSDDVHDNDNDNDNDDDDHDDHDDDDDDDDHDNKEQQKQKRQQKQQQQQHSSNGIWAISMIRTVKIGRCPSKCASMKRVPKILLQSSNSQLMSIPMHASQTCQRGCQKQ